MQTPELGTYIRSKAFFRNSEFLNNICIHHNQLRRKKSRMDSERIQLQKRHSFPYMKVYTWNMLNSASNTQVDIPLDQVESAPAISSDGTSDEREVRLEKAMLWIRKELVSKTISIQYFMHIHLVGQKEIYSIT